MAHMRARSPLSIITENRRFHPSFDLLLDVTKGKIGFDPTVKRVRFHKEICYVYQVGGRFFRTIKSLFISRVLCITGRKTRVWEAVEVAGTSEE